MSNERIDHVAEAREYEKEACGAQRIGEESAEAMATLALMKATLAMVEQQRIANLIALLQCKSSIGDYGVDGLAEFIHDEAAGYPKAHLRPEVREALGL